MVNSRTAPSKQCEDSGLSSPPKTYESEFAGVSRGVPHYLLCNGPSVKGDIDNTSSSVSANYRYLLEVHFQCNESILLGVNKEKISRISESMFDGSERGMIGITKS